jgi:hypothetical protein
MSEQVALIFCELFAPRGRNVVRKMPMPFSAWYVEQ